MRSFFCFCGEVFGRCDDDFFNERIVVLVILHFRIGLLHPRNALLLDAGEDRLKATTFDRHKKPAESQVDAAALVMIEPNQISVAEAGLQPVAELQLKEMLLHRLTDQN